MEIRNFLITYIVVPHIRLWNIWFCIGVCTDSRLQNANMITCLLWQYQYLVWRLEWYFPKKQSLCNPEQESQTLSFNRSLTILINPYGAITTLCLQANTVVIAPSSHFFHSFTAQAGAERHTQGGGVMERRGMDRERERRASLEWHLPGTHHTGASILLGNIIDHSFMSQFYRDKTWIQTQLE